MVSGIGIVSIYQYLRDDLRLAAESSDLSAAFQTWEMATKNGQVADNPAAVIAKHAIAQTDMLCCQAMQLFVEIYGAETGNFALKRLPYSGLYMTGGIAAKILPLIKQGNFLRAFSQKGCVSALLEQIPIHIVLNPRVGLIGAALYAARLGS